MYAVLTGRLKVNVDAENVTSGVVWATADAASARIKSGRGRNMEVFLNASYCRTYQKVVRDAQGFLVPI
jgi:hypothetical protein